METVLEFRNIKKQYGNEVVVDNLNLKINKGNFLCIVGTSGSGKTTILKMINGLVTPNEGEVVVEGKQIDMENINQLRRKIGYVIQGNILFPHMTVYENISYVLNIEKKQKDEIDERVDEMLNLVQLPLNIKDKYPNELSGGQQQRVGIARAYVNKPDILLMDEPFGAVDSITRCQLQRDLKEIHRKTNCTVVFITHDMYEAMKLSTHILVMDRGSIEQYGRKEEIWNNPKTEFVKTLVEMSKLEEI